MGMVWESLVATLIASNCRSIPANPYFKQYMDKITEKGFFRDVEKGSKGRCCLFILLFPMMYTLMTNMVISLLLLGYYSLPGPIPQGGGQVQGEADGEAMLRHLSFPSIKHFALLIIVVLSSYYGGIGGSQSC